MPRRGSRAITSYAAKTIASEENQAALSTLYACPGKMSEGTASRTRRYSFAFEVCFVFCATGFSNPFEN